MIISNRITRKYLVVIICTIIVAQSTESHSSNHLNRTLHGHSRDNRNHEKPSQKQGDANDRETSSTEIDQLIRNAVSVGIFKSKEEWAREQNTVPTTITNSYDDDKNIKVVRRTTKGHKVDDNAPVSDPSRPGGDAIQFPGDMNTRQVRYVPEPGSCKGNSICEDAPNYPEQVIRNAIKSYKGELFFTNDALPEDSGMDIGQRIGDADSRSETVEFCDREVKRIEPKSGITVSGESRFIVNVGNLTHTILVERCLNANTQCNFTTGLLVLGYYPNCVQKFVHRDLHALQPDGTTIRLETFQIAASCCCELRFDGTMNRMKTSSALQTKD